MLLRLRLAGGDTIRRADRVKLEHYDASLEMLRERIPGHPLVDQLAAERDALQAVSGL